MDEAVRRDIENKILSGSWEAIRRRLSSDTAKRIFRAADLNGDGHNFFHILCGQNDAPRDILEKMLATDDAYLSKKSGGEERTALHNGRTALHFAAETGSVATIKFLLDLMCKVAPWSADEGDKRSHMWLDEYYNTPLDILWKSRLDPDYVMWNGENNAVQSVIELIKRMDKVRRYGDMTAEMQDLWEKTMFFVHVAFTGSTQEKTLPRGEQWLITHEMVKHGGRNDISFPNEVLWFATKLYPDLLRVRNECHDLPLHIALKRRSVSIWRVLDELNELETWDELQNDEHIQSIFNESRGRSVVSALLWEFPESASIEDGSGKLPLQIVCEHMWAEKDSDFKENDLVSLLEAAPEAALAFDKDGNTRLHLLCKLLFRSKCDRIVILWTILHIVKLVPQAARIRDQSGRLPLNIMLHNGGHANLKFLFQEKHTYWTIVSKLANLTPHALDVPDVMTRLFPFMIAAAGKNASLDCTYIMLRKSPMNVRSGIIGSDYERCLERKVNELTSRVKHLEDELVNAKASAKKRKLRV